MAESSLARRSDWWPGRRMTEWVDWPGLIALREGDRMLRIEEFHDGDTLVIRSEMPGIDPDKDVEIDVRDPTLEIKAERRENKTREEKGTRRSEFRYGSFFRAVPLPADATEGDVQASYKDGVLEVRGAVYPDGRSDAAPHPDRTEVTIAARRIIDQTPRCLPEALLR
jgi:HSP20 family protein